MAKKLEFRDLTASDVEVRISQVKENGVVLLLYKDARVDQSILDDTVGAMNWKKSYEVIKDNLFCSISIYDSEKHEWVSKTDVGVESYADKEKGEASDAQKRAGFVWGIGRELYTAPFIWLKPDGVNVIVKQVNGRFTCYDNFEVSEMDVRDKKITSLTIINSKTKNVVFSTKTKINSVNQQASIKQIKKADTTIVVNNKPQSMNLETALNFVVRAKAKDGKEKEIVMKDMLKTARTKEAIEASNQFLLKEAKSKSVNAEACKTVFLAIKNGEYSYPALV